MPLVILDDEDQPPAPDGPRLRVIVLPPLFVERLIGRVARFLTGGA